MNARLVTPVVGVGLYLLAPILPVPTVTEASAQTSRPTAPVTAVVRNDLGQLKWMATEATDYTPLEAAGRDLYLRAGCTYCHSQHMHPATSETRPWGTVSADPRRWGPASEPGEYAYDVPPSFGARGIAPDLSRTGLKYGDEWHLAHFWNPPMVTPGSIMGGFSGLFDAPAEPVRIVDGEAPAEQLRVAGDEVPARTLERTAATERLFDFASKQQVKLTPNEQGVLFVPTGAKGKYPLVWTPNDEYAGETVKLVAETRDIEALTAYVQKLGTNRGMWRDLYLSGEVEGSPEADLPRSEERIARGRQVYERHCVACHGVKGDGNGPAATFLHEQRPRNFTFGVFKFRLTDGTLPSDADLMRTLTRGVRGSAMPAWFELPVDDRLAVIQYVKYELAADRSDPSSPYFFFVEEPPGPPMTIAAPPPPTAAMVGRGQEIWRQAKCWECHGQAGRGDGEKAAGLKDDWGFPVVPANLTRGQFKSGPTVTDVFRTLATGLSGTPMASFRDAFPEADRWALAYYVLSLSAYTDPLTGAPVPVPAAARAALNDPELETAGPGQAYGLPQPCRGVACAASAAAVPSVTPTSGAGK